jgi:tetratricopeptide (TPR) repeat protein
MRKLNRILAPLIAICLVATFGAGCTKKAKAARHLKNADRYYAKGFYNSAEIEYMNTLQLDRTNSKAIRQLGTLYFDQGRFARAFQFLYSASQKYPQDLDLRIKLASLYVASHRSGEAQAQANYVLDKSPTNAEAPLLLAESVFTRTNIPVVRTRLMGLMSKVGETAPLVLSMGILALMDGNTGEAEQNFKRSMALDPKFSAAPSALGNYYWSQGDTNRADEALKLASELSPARSPRRLGYAEFKLRTGEVDEAKKLLAAITQQVPDYLPAWHRQALVALAERDYTNCASLLKRELALDPNNYEGLLLRGQMFLQQGEGAKAVAEFDRLKSMQWYANVPQVHYNLALAQLYNKDARQALQSLNRAVLLNTNYVEAELALAELNIQMTNSAAAIAPLTQLTKQRPQIPQGHLLLAGAYLAQQDLDSAAAVYRQAMKLYTNSPQLPWMLGLVLLDQKKPAEARKEFERALELKADYLPAIGQLTELDVTEKKFDSALRRAQAQVDKDPNSAMATIALASVYTSKALDTARKAREKLPAQEQARFTLAQVPAAQEDAARAEALFRKVIDTSTNTTAAPLLLAQLLVESGKDQQALEDLQKMVARTTNNAAAYFQIGMLQDQRKDYTAATAAYEKVLAINPRHTLAINNLAYDYCEHLNQLDKAYELATRAREMDPREPFFADTLGWVLYRKGDYARAAEAIQESANGQPNHPEVQYHLGMARYMTGDEAAARAAFEKALKSEKDFTGKEEARSRLEFLNREFKSGDTAAVSDLEKRVADNPRDVVAAARLGAIYEGTGNFEKAASAYERVLSQSPKNGRVIGRLAILYAGPLKDSSKALKWAKEANSLNPDDAVIGHLLGRLVYQTGDYRWSQSLLQEAGRKGENAELLYDLAWADYKMGQVSESEASMQRAIQLDPKFNRSSDARRFLALVAAARTPAQAKAAADQAQQALAAEPDYLPALMVSALVQEQQKNYGDARKTYERILTSDSMFLPATRNLAILMGQYFEDDSKAYDLAIKARDAFPEDGEIARTLAILTYRSGDASRAEPLLRESAQKRPEDGELQYYLGMAYHKLQRPADCKAALTNALALNIPGKLAAEAQKVLLELK